MPIINIEEKVLFAPNLGVLIERKAGEEDPHRLRELIRVAWQHMDDPYLVDARCGARGPLSEYGELDYEDYLRLTERIRISEETKRAKREHTRIRRAQYFAKRSQLILAMIESGIPYVCNRVDCTKTQDLTIDHMIPLSKGGTDELTNLQFLCRRHNSRKSDDLETYEGVAAHNKWRNDKSHGDPNL